MCPLKFHTISMQLCYHHATCSCDGARTVGPHSSHQPARWQPDPEPETLIPPACADPLQYAQRGFEISQMTSKLWTSTRLPGGMPLGDQELIIRGFPNHFWYASEPACKLWPCEACMLHGQPCSSCALADWTGSSTPGALLTLCATWRRILQSTDNQTCCPSTAATISVGAQI